MAFYRPEGNFGPVCDPIGGITIQSDPVILDEQVQEDDFVECSGYAVYPSNPSWLDIPTQVKVLCRDDGRDFTFQVDRPELLEIDEELNNKIAQAFTNDVAPYVAPPAFDVNTFCEESFPDANIDPDRFQGKTRYYKVRSTPRSYNVENESWDDEMNERAIWLSPGVCSFEGKTIANGDAPKVASNITIPTTGTYTIRYRFSKQGEVWLNYAEPGQQQLLNLTETRSSYDNARFDTKVLSLSAGEYLLTAFMENPTVGTFKKNWDDSPIAFGMEIWQGTYGVTTTYGVPTAIGIQTIQSQGITYTNQWNSSWIPNYTDHSTVFDPSESGQEYAVTFSGANGLAGTAKVSPLVLHIYTSGGNTTVYVAAQWSVTSITSYGSNYSVDDTINLSYTGSVGGTATANVKVFLVEDVTTTTGTLLFSTQENMAGFDTSFIPFVV